MSEVMWEDESEDEDNDDGGELWTIYGHINIMIVQLTRDHCTYTFKGGKANYHDENGREVGQVMVN